MMMDNARAVKRIGRNAVARLAAQVASRLLSLALVALVARYENAVSLGRYALIMTVVSILGAVADLGLNVWLTREVARLDEGEGQREALGIVLQLKLGLSMVGMLLLSAAALAGPWPEPTQRALFVGSLLLVPEEVLGALRAFVNGRQRMEISALVDVFVRAIGLAGSTAALELGLSIGGVLIATAGASAIGVLLYSGVLWRWRSWPALRLAPARWRTTLIVSYPFALTGIIAMAYARGGLLLLGFWQGEAAAGWYSAAHKLWEAVAMVPANIIDAMFPEISRLAVSREGARRLRQLLCSALLAMLAVGLLMSLAGIIGAGVLVRLLYGADGGYAAAVLPFQLLICAAPATFAYLLGGHLLYALDQQRRVTSIMLAVGLSNLLLNALTIPRWSYVGVAGVALFSEWALAALLFTQGRRALEEQTRVG